MVKIVKLICEECKSSFEVIKGKEKKFCSNECKSQHRKKLDRIFYIDKNCECCGKIFTSKKKENKKYCSYECSGNAKKIISREIRICKECGIEFEERIKYDKNFCSNNCRIKWQLKPENIRSRIEKSKKSILNKYGEDSIFKIRSYQDNIRKLSDIRTIDSKKEITSKIRSTKLKIYGDENYNNVNKIKETKLFRYDNKNYNNRTKFYKTINDKFINRLIDRKYKLIEFMDDDIIKIEHPDGHIFESPRALLIIRLNENRELSTKYLPHSPNISNYELEISDFLKENNIEFNSSDKLQIKPYELDFYIPKYKLGIEFNGLYWHSEYHKSPEYHLNKLKMCNNVNINLLQIFEDEWVHKKDIVKSMIKNKLGLNKNKIFARNTVISIIDNNTYNNFLNENHILGSTKSSIKIGLYYNNELVSVMGFKIENNSTYNLNRFCGKKDYNIVGGASKLLNFFIKNYKCDKIITFADKRYSIGSLYEKLGFNILNILRPTYWYCDYREIRRYHKFNFRKSRLVKFNNKLTEHEIMLNNRIPRIYDCGLIKYEMKINNPTN